MEGKIVYQGKSKSGRDVTLRYPKSGDATAMCQFINELSQEQTFILWQGEQITEENEEKYLQGLLQGIAGQRSVAVMAFSDSELLGWGSIDLSRMAEKHVGEFHISIEKDSRGDGIGSLLMNYIIEEAINQLPLLRVIRLGVFATNPIAIEMYKKHGFIEYGRLPEGLLSRGEYIDHIYMYKKVRD